MYVHPAGSYARFLLMGLRPETQYTVVASYGVATKFNLGDLGREIFRTDYARLADIETSGLTHTEATVTVSLAGADLDRSCCFKWYPHSNEDEDGYTYYLRHKASDDTVWSDPVELTLSDFAADVRLTGLDQGAAYDVEINEDPTFMPRQASVGSYQATLTVGADDFGYVGLDLSGGFVDPFGSISPTTFELGGVEYSIIALYPDLGELQPGFDKALPDGVEFTLTLGTTEFDSSDVSSGGGANYRWAGGPELVRRRSGRCAIGLHDPRGLQGGRHAARRLHHPHHAPDAGLRDENNGGCWHFLRWV